jgi:transcriptional regulator with XRE-family HTH domain
METNHFGLCLAQLRRKNQLRQKQVAFDAGLDPSYLAALENGRRIPPRPNMMIKLVSAVKATSNEEKELRRAAMLSFIARELSDCTELISGASAAMTILELSSVLSQEELQALVTLVEGYRFRVYAQGRKVMN